MGAYINAGARSVAGEVYPSKAALRRALAATPEEVLIYHTAALFDGERTMRAPEIEEAQNYTLVGPDPERDRRWYGTLTRRGRSIRLD